MSAIDEPTCESGHSDSSRRPYKKPQVFEWGSIVDLTQISGQGSGDAYGGGTGTGFREPPRIPPT